MSRITAVATFQLVANRSDHELARVELHIREKMVDADRGSK